MMHMRAARSALCALRVDVRALRMMCSHAAHDAFALSACASIRLRANKISLSYIYIMFAYSQQGGGRTLTAAEKAKREIEARLEKEHREATKAAAAKKKEGRAAGQVRMKKHPIEEEPKGDPWGIGQLAVKGRARTKQPLEGRAPSPGLKRAASTGRLQFSAGGSPAQVAWQQATGGVRSRGARGSASRTSPSVSLDKARAILRQYYAQNGSLMGIRSRMQVGSGLRERLSARRRRSNAGIAGVTSPRRRSARASGRRSARRSTRRSAKRSTRRSAKRSAKRSSRRASRTGRRASRTVRRSARRASRTVRRSARRASRTARRSARRSTRRSRSRSPLRLLGL